MDFVTTIIHPVANPIAAAAFLCNTLGFQKKSSSTDALVVDNGSVAVRLVLRPALEQGVLNVELHTQNLGDATTTLLALPAVTLLQARIAIGNTRLESRLQGPHGIIITVAQEFTEDELDILPPLPTSLIWDGQAESCIRQILRLIPIDFRDGARLRITEKAEMLAGENAAITVTLDNALQALADITPHFQHPLLLSALQQQGIDASGHFQRAAS